MFLIVYSRQRYKIKIRKTNLMTIIFGWERELGGDGEEGRENWGGRQGRPRSRPTRLCLVEQGPLGTDRGQAREGARTAGEEGRGSWGRGLRGTASQNRDRWERTGDRWRRREDRLGTETGAGGNKGKDRWQRPAPTISCPLKAHDKRGA